VPRLMSPVRRTICLVLGAALAAATLSASVRSLKAPQAFTPFLRQAPPQRALGDFDGDGRVDTALIQGGASEGRISVQLSGSTSVVRLDARVSGVIEGDVDHDGDLDLVAFTPDGEVLIWLNDGRGRFTRQAASQSRNVLSDPIIVQTAWPESVAVGIGAPMLPSPTLGDTALMVARVGAPTLDVPRDLRCQILPALRAPPAALA
jgi:FG-GAP-like repeat